MKRVSSVSLSGKKTYHKVANIGDRQILECDVNFPNSEEHLLTWKRADQEVPIYIIFNGYSPHVDEGEWSLGVAEGGRIENF